MDELIRWEREKWAGFEQKDTKRLEQLYDPDAVSIGYAEDGSAGPRRTADLLEGLGDLDVRQVELDEFTTIPLGADAAVVTYRASYQEHEGGLRTVRASSVWQRSGDRWTTKFLQATAVGPHG